MLQYIIAFVAGALVKTVDWLDDTKKSKNPIKYGIAILYGVSIGYLISLPQFSAIFLAALAAQVFARKVDTAAHRLGFLIAAVSLLFFSFPAIEPMLFFFFLIMAVLDEMDYIGRLRPLVEYRPFLKVGSLLPIVWGVWTYFFGIIIFDIGYELVTALTKSREEEKAAVSRADKAPAKERPYRPKTRNPKPGSQGA